MVQYYILTLHTWSAAISNHWKAAQLIQIFRAIIVIILEDSGAQAEVLTPSKPKNQSWRVFTKLSSVPNFGSIFQDLVWAQDF